MASEIYIVVLTQYIPRVASHHAQVLYLPKCDPRVVIMIDPSSFCPTRYSQSIDIAEWSVMHDEQLARCMWYPLQYVSTRWMK